MKLDSTVQCVASGEASGRWLLLFLLLLSCCNPHILSFQLSCCCCCDLARSLFLLASWTSVCGFDKRVTSRLGHCPVRQSICPALPCFALPCTHGGIQGSSSSHANPRCSPSLPSLSLSLRAFHGPRPTLTSITHHARVNLILYSSLALHFTHAPSPPYPTQHEADLHPTLASQPASQPTSSPTSPPCRGTANSTIFVATLATLGPRFQVRIMLIAQLKREKQY